MRRSLSRSLVALSLVALSSCAKSTSVEPKVPTGNVRAVHGSPDAGPVDIYVYASATRPSTPAVADATYPQITNFLALPAATYTVDVLPHGAPSTASAVASEKVTVAANTANSIVVGGRASAGTLQFINFVEPAEVAGQTALVVHHASPFVQAAIAPVGVGVYDAAPAAGGTPAAATEVFAFSLASSSGPATSGNAPVDGEFFLSPLPSTLPAAVGFAAGAPSSPGQPLASIAVHATPSQLASVLTNKTAAQQTLAADASSAVPAGAHLSIFAIDTSTAAELVGTLDP